MRFILNRVSSVAAMQESGLRFALYCVARFDFNRGLAGSPGTSSPLSGFNRLARCGIIVVPGDCEPDNAHDEATQWLHPTIRWRIATRKFLSERVNSRHG